MYVYVKGKWSVFIYSIIDLFYRKLSGLNIELQALFSLGFKNKENLYHKLTSPTETGYSLENCNKRH